MPERFSPAQPNYLRFVSTPTIDIEPEKIVDLPQCGPFLRVGRGRISIFHLVFGGYLTVQAIDQRLRCIAIHHGDRHRLPAF